MLLLKEYNMLEFFFYELVLVVCFLSHKHCFKTHYNFDVIRTFGLITVINLEAIISALGNHLLKIQYCFD